MALNTILHVSTYRPRMCGNAEATGELIASLKTARPDWQHVVAAVNYASDDAFQYPEEVGFVLRQGVAEDYTKLSNAVNSSPHIKLVHIQYESGFFGEPGWKRSIVAGIKKTGPLHALLSFLVPFRLDEHALLLYRKIKKPIITTLWAPYALALQNDYWLKHRLRTITTASRAVIVHSRLLKKDLEKHCALPSSRLVFLPVGSLPPRYFKKPGSEKSPFPRDKFIFLSAGFLRPNQRFDLAINALRKIKDQYPDVQYWIVGAPHPEMKGEKYLDGLRAKVLMLNLEDRVVIKTEFLAAEDFINHLRHAQVCVLPYRNRNKYASGILAYSLACGTPCISTRFPYAVEYLSGDAGKLVDFEDVNEMSEAMAYFSGSIPNYEKARKAAVRIGDGLRWNNAIHGFVGLYDRVMDVT